MIPYVYYTSKKRRDAKNYALNSSEYEITAICVEKPYCTSASFDTDKERETF